MAKAIKSKICLILLVTILLSCIVYSGYDTRWNSWTNRLDYVKDSNLSGEKLFIGEANVNDNLTVNGYLAVATASSIMNMSNQSVLNVTDNLVYKLNNFTDIAPSSLNAYSDNGTVLTLITSDNYTFDATKGQWALSVITYNNMNVTLDYARYYLPVNLSAGDLFADGWGYFDYVNASVEMFGPQNWTDNQNYPSCAPSGTYLTCLGDSVTTTRAMRVTGENATGNYTLTKGTVFFNGSLPLYHGIRFALENGTGAFTYNESYDALLQQNLSLWNESWDKYNDTYEGYRGNVSLNYSLNSYNMWDDRWTATYNDSYLERNASTDLNMSNNDIWDTNKLAFHLGEYIDNLVDGWLKFWGSVFITEDLNVTGTTDMHDDLNLTDNDIHDVDDLYVTTLHGGSDITVADNLNMTHGGVARNITNAAFLNDVINVSGLISEPPYIFSHTDAQQKVTAAGTWINVSFNESSDTIISGITHVHNDETNDTFTVPEDGIYNLKWAINFQDTAANPADTVVARVWQVGSGEIVGSIFEKDTTKQNAIGSIHHAFKARLSAGDKVKLQVTGGATTISLTNKGNYGDHRDVATFDIERFD